jgi:hypothetical protein
MSIKNLKEKLRMKSDIEKVFMWIKINISVIWLVLLIMLIGYSFDMYLTGVLILISMSILIVWIYDPYPLSILLNKLVEMDKKNKKSDNDGESI